LGGSSGNTARAEKRETAGTRSLIGSGKSRTSRDGDLFKKPENSSGDKGDQLWPVQTANGCHQKEMIRKKRSSRRRRGKTSNSGGETSSYMAGSLKRRIGEVNGKGRGRKKINPAKMFALCRESRKKKN